MCRPQQILLDGAPPPSKRSRRHAPHGVLCVLVGAAYPLPAEDAAAGARQPADTETETTTRRQAIRAIRMALPGYSVDRVEQLAAAVERTDTSATSCHPVRSNLERED